MNNKNLDFISLSSLLTNFMPKEHQWKLKIFNHWEEIVGKLKNVVSIEKIEDNFVLLNVPHSSWAQELNFLQNIIMSKINNVLGEDKIKSIKFRVGIIRKNNKNKKVQNQTSNQIPTVKNVKKTNLIKECSKKISNDDLKTAVEAYLLRCLNQKEKLNE